MFCLKDGEFSGAPREVAILLLCKYPYGTMYMDIFKVIRKFFKNHNKSFRWHLGDYEKHNRFPFEGL